MGLETGGLSGGGFLMGGAGAGGLIDVALEGSRRSLSLGLLVVLGVGSGTALVGGVVTWGTLCSIGGSSLEPACGGGGSALAGGVAA